MLNPADLNAAIQRGADGDPWYGPDTYSLIAELSAAEAAARPGFASHSVWEILSHMIGWSREVERRLAGSEPELPPGGDWPAISDISELSWDSVKQDFILANRALGERIAVLEPELFSRLCGGERIAELGTGQTIAEVVLGVVQHNAYHTGQIALIVKAIQS